MTRPPCPTEGLPHTHATQFVKKLPMIRAILAITFLAASASAAFAQEAKSLFDGKTLDGWKGDSSVWSVQDGAITATVANQQLKHNTFLIWQGGDVADFELTCKYKMVGN